MIEDYQPAFPKPGKTKAPPSKRTKTKEEKEHLAFIASIPCSIESCTGRSCVHHIREYGEPKDHFKTIPLCHHHHQGAEGIHDGLGKKRWRERFGHELEYLEKIKNLLKKP